MSEPFIFIASYRVKPDFLDVAPLRLREVTALVEEQEPQLQSFHFYLDEDRGRAICVQVHPDAESMATHMAVIAHHLATAWDWLEPDSSVQQVLGNPPQALTDYAREFNEQLDSYPTFVAGFTRTAAQFGIIG
ncbi:MAG TPA: hypothetical protein VK964_00480 [Nocardioidaceae bacterium]|nr:hypothetical protein [Nocardioidaceae bacterium]